MTDKSSPAAEEICGWWQLLPGALQDLNCPLSFLGAQSLWFEAQTKHVPARTRSGRGRRDRYERGIHISQSWSSASVWQNTQVPVLVNYCFDRMSLQFCRVCVRAPSAAPPLYLRPKATVTEPGGEWETKAGRQKEREGKREGNRRKKGAIIHLSSAWWNAILTEAANRSITGAVRAGDNSLPVRSVWALGTAALPFFIKTSCNIWHTTPSWEPDGFSLLHRQWMKTSWLEVSSSPTWQQTFQISDGSRL